MGKAIERHAKERQNDPGIDDSTENTERSEIWVYGKSHVDGTKVNFQCKKNRTMITSTKRLSSPVEETPHY
jgi:hypothetical protein